MRLPEIEKIFKRGLLGVFKTILPAVTYQSKDVDLDSVKKVIVIRQHDQLGDLLLSTPAFRAIKRSLPRAQLTVVARQYTYRVLENNPEIDRILVFPEKLYQATPAKLWKLWRGLRQDYDLAIVLNTISHSLSSDILARLTGAKFILGSAENPLCGSNDNFFYNIRAPGSDIRLHETRRNLKILEHIGIHTEDFGESVVLSAPEEEQGKDILYNNHIMPERTVGIHLGAYNICNRWPHQNYAALADWLVKEFGFQVAVFWGPREQELGERFLGSVKSEVKVLSGLDIRQLASVIKPLRLMVCNDTGVMHLSAAVGAPTFAIFGRSEPEYWRPLNRNFYGVRGLDKTCASAELDVVQSGIKRMLAREDL
jgi:ADP-heptose:LPS heptosyltransferase